MFDRVCMFGSGRFYVDIFDYDKVFRNSFYDGYYFFCFLVDVSFFILVYYFMI